MPEFEPTRPVIEPSGPIQTPTLEGLAAQIEALQAQVASLLTESRGWNATASAVTELQSQVAPLVGHTHQIGKYQYTVQTTESTNLGPLNSFWTIPAISLDFTDVAAQTPTPSGDVKPVQSGPPVPAAIGF